MILVWDYLLPAPEVLLCTVTAADHLQRPLVLRSAPAFLCGANAGCCSAGTFPYYSMLFYCDGNLNLESLPVDSCVNSGRNCGQPAADAFCRYMGFEQAVEDLFTTVQASGPTRSMTGAPSMIYHQPGTGTVSLLQLELACSDSRAACTQPASWPAPASCS